MFRGKGCLNKGGKHGAQEEGKEGELGKGVGMRKEIAISGKGKERESGIQRGEREWEERVCYKGGAEKGAREKEEEKKKV